MDRVLRRIDRMSRRNVDSKDLIGQSDFNRRAPTNRTAPMDNSPLSEGDDTVPLDEMPVPPLTEPEDTKGG
jgi:hypothetical protein